MKETEDTIITQNWLKSIYGHNPLFTIDLTGKENTIKGLIQALQIELRVTVNGIWENETTEAFEELFPDGLSAETDSSEDNRVINIIYILQGAFYTAREISPGGMDGYFGEGLTTAIKTFQKQAGLTEDGIVKAYLLKAILSLDSYELEEEGDSQVRIIQQNLNHKYCNYIGLIPTNGIYDRRTNDALRKIIQIEMNAIGNEL